MRRPDERPVLPGFTRLVILIPDELADQLDEVTCRGSCPGRAGTRFSKRCGSGFCGATAGWGPVAATSRDSSRSRGRGSCAKRGRRFDRVLQGTVGTVGNGHVFHGFYRPVRFLTTGCRT